MSDLAQLIEQAKADGNSAQVRKLEFLRDHGFNSNKDYSDDFQALFGSDRTNVGINYTGPNPSWSAALKERLAIRARGGPDHATGFYELSTSNMDPDLRAKCSAETMQLRTCFVAATALNKSVPIRRGKKMFWKKVPVGKITVPLD